MSIGFQFVVCRYVADTVRDEAINIGIILHSHTHGFTDCHLTRAFATGAAVRKNPDLEILLAVVDDLEERFSFSKGFLTDLEADDLRDPTLLTRLSDSYCNQLQFTKPRPYVATSVVEAREHLYSLYVAATRDSRPTSHDSYWLRRQLHHLFTERGISNKVKSNITLKDKWDAPLNLDFQWQNGSVNFVQALSLSDQREGETISKAKLWQTNYELLRSMQDYTAAEITTVVYPPLRVTKNYDIALRILRDQSSVLDFNQADAIAEKIAAHGHLLPQR